MRLEMELIDMLTLAGMKQGFEDGIEYQRVIDSLNEVKSVEEGNEDYVKGLIKKSDKKINGMKKIYGEEFCRGYEDEKSRLTKLIGEQK